jgi:lipopolysaccharide/colanic/teichoic acid biosynthesis glycosyltransferase
MTSNSRTKAETKSALSSNHSLEDDAAFAPPPRAVPQPGRGPQHFSEHPVTSLSRVEPAHLEPESILDPESRTVRSAYESAKRVFDFLLGLVLLIIAMPIIVIAAAAIRIETPGSPFFIQTRLGRDGKPFRICKLRGMYADARVRFPSYYDYSGKRDLDFCFHHEEDPRVTRAGMLIRKTSVDELPNLWNVVLGDMSLVGPRPEIPEVLALYGPYRQEYLSVKPGVTCLSKCTGRDRLTKRETIDFDIQYIRERCFIMDLTILWRTFRGVVLRRDVF